MKLHYTPTDVKGWIQQDLNTGTHQSVSYLCEDYLELWDEGEWLRGMMRDGIRLGVIRRPDPGGLTLHNTLYEAIKKEAAGGEM